MTLAWLAIIATVGRLDSYYKEVLMLARFARNVSIELGVLGVLGLWASGCIPCGFDEKQTLETPEQVSESVLSSGMQKAVGTFHTTTPTHTLAFEIDRAEIREAPGLLTYSLEVYNGGTYCPPDAASKLSVVGSATDSSSPTIAEFDFSWAASLQSLDGKVLVLRATAPSQEPSVNVVCTTPLVYTPSMSMIHCSGM